jgi:hypothetical protein
MRTRWALALALVLSACSKPKDAEGTNPSVSESATASSGKRLYRAPTPAASLDMVASEGGWSLHARAATGCSDQKCTGEKCGPLCSQYVEERFKSFATVGQKNRLYFACFGGCLAGYPDGGVADAGH